MADTSPADALFLAKGAFLALEQSGVLLRDSFILHRAGSHSSAIALAAFGREELGRYIFLRDMVGSVVCDGRTVTTKYISDECKDHEKKQLWGQLSTVQRAQVGSRLGDLMIKSMVNPPESEQYREARKQVDEVRERLEGRTPGDRHQKRMNSLYVEPRGAGWNRPIEATSADASNFLTDFRNEYAIQYQNIVGGYIESDHPEFAELLKQWKGCPQLPFPVSIS